MPARISAIMHDSARDVSAGLSPGAARGILLLVMAVAGIAGLLSAASPAAALAVSHAGADLTRLLRFMAVIKAVLAVAAAGAVVWRLGGPVSLPWLAAYAVAGGAMAAGPGVIWAMAHVGLGAVLLHGGLFATILLLWRDPATASRMQSVLAARRRFLTP